MNAQQFLLLAVLNFILMGGCENQQNENSDSPNGDLKKYSFDFIQTVEKEELEKKDSLREERNEPLISDTLIVEYPYADSAYFIQTHYRNGVRQGISRTYSKNSTRPKYMSYYENGDSIWMTIPSTDMKVTLKHGVMGKGAFIFEDSVYMVAPYKNGNTWYEGLFINKEEKGIHRVYTESGDLKFEAIYNQSDSVHIIHFNENGDTAGTWMDRRY